MPAALGQALEWLRTRNRLSQRKLARLSGVSRETVSLIERGESLPRPDTLECLARGLALDLDGRLDEDRFADYHARLFRAAGYPTAPAGTPLGGGDLSARLADLFARYPELEVAFARVSDDLTEADIRFLKEALEFIHRRPLP